MAKQARHAYPRKASVKGWVANRPPELHEKGYLVAVDGDCLEPVVHHGEIISAEPILPQPGELACFFFNKQDRGSVKLLVTPIRGFPVHPESTVIQVIEAQQLNPPKRYHCLANNLEAVHRVRWVRRDNKWIALSQLLSEFDEQHPQPKRIPVLRLSDIA
jgi:hypothetical protein